MVPKSCLRLSYFFMLAVQISCTLPRHLEPKEKIEHPENLRYDFKEAPPLIEAVAALSWKNYYKDSLLLALIDTALARNLDIKVAEQNLYAAQASLKAASGRLWPSLNFAAGAGLTRFGRQTIDGVGNYDVNFSPNISPDQRIPNPVPDFALGLQTSWEIDISGKLRQYRKAARYRYLASEEGLRFVKTQVVAGVASLYYLLIALDTELEIIRRNLELQESALEVIQIQKQSGKINELAVKQFKTQVLDTRSLEYEKMQERLAVENALNVLMARFPGRIPRKDTLNVSDLPVQIQGSIPFALLYQRPDIKSALHEAEAARHNLKAARAELYPSLLLSGTIGINGFDPAGLFSLPGSFAFNLMAGLVAPLINRYDLLGYYRLSFAEKNKALLDLQQKLITAASEVVNELNRFENFRKVADYKLEQFLLMKEALKIADQLFYTGYANYLEVLMTRQVLLRAELELTEARLQQYLASIQLLRALGGGL
jgi:NodT family efflux transporter outer membrane factor (OMF) lipoprotein